MDALEVLESVKQAKERLVEVETQFDAVIVAKGKAEAYCQQLELRRQAEEKLLAEFSANLETKRKESAEIDAKIAADSIILADIRSEAQASRAKIDAEEAKIAQDKKEVQAMKLEVAAEKQLATAARIENENLVKLNTEKALKIKEFASSI